MQSSPIVALRGLMLVACLTLIPAAAIFGTSFAGLFNSSQSQSNFKAGEPGQSPCRRGPGACQDAALSRSGQRRGRLRPTDAGCEPRRLGFSILWGPEC